MHRIPWASLRKWDIYLLLLKLELEHKTPRTYWMPQVNGEHPRLSHYSLLRMRKKFTSHWIQIRCGKELTLSHFIKLTPIKMCSHYFKDESHLIKHILLKEWKLSLNILCSIRKKNVFSFFHVHNFPFLRQDRYPSRIDCSILDNGVLGWQQLWKQKKAQ